MLCTVSALMLLFLHFDVTVYVLMLPFLHFDVTVSAFILPFLHFFGTITDAIFPRFGPSTSPEARFWNGVICRVVVSLADNLNETLRGGGGVGGSGSGGEGGGVGGGGRRGGARIEHEHGHYAAIGPFSSPMLQYTLFIYYLAEGIPWWCLHVPAASTLRMRSRNLYRRAPAHSPTHPPAQITQPRAPKPLLPPPPPPPFATSPAKYSTSPISIMLYTVHTRDCR